MITVISKPSGEIFATLNLSEFRKRQSHIIIFDDISVEVQKAGFNCEAYSPEKANIPGHLLLHIWNPKKELSIKKTTQLFYILLKLRENRFVLLD